MLHGSAADQWQFGHQLGNEHLSQLQHRQCVLRDVHAVQRKLAPERVHAREADHAYGLAIGRTSLEVLVRRPEPTSAPCSPPRVLYLPAGLLIGDLVELSDALHVTCQRWRNVHACSSCALQDGARASQQLDDGADLDNNHEQLSRYELICAARGRHLLSTLISVKTSLLEGSMFHLAVKNCQQHTHHDEPPVSL